MPLECSELFSMAPLARGSHTTEYVVPKDVDLGVGKIRSLQEELVFKFEKLASETNTYLDSQARSVHYGFEAFEVTLQDAKKSIRGIREEIVQLMAAIYKQGHTPLPPDKRVDEDVARILEDSSITVAAEVTATKSVATLRAKPVLREAATSEGAVGIRSNTRAVSPTRPKLISKGASARARAEAAWAERARASRENRARAESRYRARAACEVELHNRRSSLQEAL